MAVEIRFMKKYIYKIKNLPKDFNLVGCKLNKQTIVSGWNKGFWMTDNYQDYINAKQTKVEPIFFKNFDEIKNWEVKVPIERILQYERGKKMKTKEKIAERSKYWPTMCDILDRHFPKGECQERGKAICMLAYLEMMLNGVEFGEDGEPKLQK